MRAHVRVPATSANLGPGFDALGLALAWYDDVTAVRVGVGDCRWTCRASCAADVPRDERHLVVRAMDATFAELGERARRSRAALREPHPARRRARLLGGRRRGRCAAGPRPGPRRRRPARRRGRARVSPARLEGHPDNAAAALLGGFTIAWPEPPGARAVRLDPAPSLRAVVLLPDSDPRHRPRPRPAARRPCRTPTRRTPPPGRRCWCTRSPREPGPAAAPRPRTGCTRPTASPAMPQTLALVAPAPVGRAGRRRVRSRAQRPRAGRRGAHRGRGGRGQWHATVPGGGAGRCGPSRSIGPAPRSADAVRSDGVARGPIWRVRERMRSPVVLRSSIAPGATLRGRCSATIPGSLSSWSHV